MSVAITGATGFLGSHLVKRLKTQDVTLSLLDREKHNLFKPETLKASLLKSDVVVHLAAVNRDPDFNKILRVNILGTKGLLDAMSEYTPRAKLIFASSFQAYLKDSAYGASKRLAEELIESYVSSRLIDSAVILRFSNLYGVGSRPFYNSVIATFVNQIKRGEILVINGDGRQKRDYLWVSDAAESIIKAIEYKARGVEYFDICSGKLTSINQIINILRRLSEKPMKIRYNTGVSDGWLIKKNFAKAKRFLKWEPRVNLVKGLEEMVVS